MAESVFVAGRLRLARDLRSWSQVELAQRAGLTPPTLSQFEAGMTRPVPAARDRLAAALGVPAGFFELPLLDTHDGFFRSLRRTSVADRRRARAMAHIAHDLAGSAAIAGELPAVNVPHLTSALVADDAEQSEAIAREVRRLWGVHAGPISNATELLESHGVVVIRLPLATNDVDAFSLPFRDRPIVVLGADKNDRARSRFDVAHELGHLVVHGEQVWGLPAVERQASQFAAAFLMPRDEIIDELPARANWPVLFSLKRKWQVSLAALLMRARTLRRMSEADYLTAIKAASARGWRRIEPVPLGAPEQPRLLARALHLLNEQESDLALPESVLASLAAALAA
ncbi:MAG: XRE family transcriptional regulator [Candidatus Dormibacteraeota bacterium]|nr:XRE family transcriptional regulator [Candidatus Dormibacteraeota bacterium]